MKTIARALALVALTALTVSAEEAPKQDGRMACCKKADDTKMCAKDSGCCKDCCSKHSEEHKH